MAAILLSVALVAAAGAAVYAARTVLVLLLIGLFLAVILDPLVRRLCRWNLSRGQAVAVVALLALIMATGASLLVVPPLVEQVAALVAGAPRLVQRARESRLFDRLDARWHITEALQRELGELPALVSKAAGELLQFLGGFARVAAAAITVLIATVFILLSLPRLERGALALAPPPSRERWRALGLSVYSALTRYAVGTLAISALGGTVAAMSLAIAGVPFFLPMGVVVMFLALIPLVGSAISAVLMGLATLVTRGWLPALIVVAAFILYQQIENNVLHPMVHRRTVSLSPLAVLVAILVGADVAGVLGALFAIPAASVIAIVAADWWRLRVQETPPPGPTPPEPPSRRPGGPEAGVPTPH